MGSGIIINGRMHAGRDDLAGEVGHVRMADEGPVGFNKAGSFEGFCSGGGITRLAQSRIRAAWQRGETVGFCADAAACEKLALKTVADAARAGDPLAKGVFETSAFYLGTRACDPRRHSESGGGGDRQFRQRVRPLREPAPPHRDCAWLAEEALPDAVARCKNRSGRTRRSQSGDATPALGRRIRQDSRG
jgi:hypothetical protein